MDYGLGCSCHMTGNDKWFSSLTPTRHKEYIIFGDNGKDKVRGVGAVRVSDRFTLRGCFGFESWL